MTPITVVRHAESEANRAKVLSGQTPEVPLTDLGHSQARAAGEQLARELRGRPVRILASPYTRTVETAKHIARALGVPEHEIVTDPALRERSFGVLEGSHDIAMHKLPGYVLMQGKKAVRANEHWRPEGGESLEDVRQRVVPLIDHHVRQYPGHHHVIVTHGHVVKAMHAHAHDSWDKIPRAENAEPRELPWPVKQDVVEALLAGEILTDEAIWLQHAQHHTCYEAKCPGCVPPRPRPRGIYEYDEWFDSGEGAFAVHHFDGEAYVAGNMGRRHEIESELRRQEFHELADHIAKKHKPHETLSYLSGMELPAEERGKGVGSDMLRTTLAGLQQHRVKHVYLHASGDAQRLHKFYTRHGFKRLGTHDLWPTYYRRLP